MGGTFFQVCRRFASTCSSIRAMIGANAMTMSMVSGAGTTSARSMMVMMCEVCGTKHASYGTPMERKRWWYSSCGRQHDAVRVNGEGSNSVHG